MGSTTEIFVLVLFILSFPISITLLKSAELPGDRYFFSAYIFLLLSNAFTVIEEYFFYEFFDLLEHFSIAMSAFLLFLAIRKFTRSPNGMRH